MIDVVKPGTISNPRTRVLIFVPGNIPRRNLTKHTMANLKPLGDKVVVEVRDAEDKTASGIFLPDSAKKKPQEGTVIATGSGRMLDNGERNKLSVKVGDKVLFSKYGGNEVALDGKDYTILDEDQIYAVLG